MKNKKIHISWIIGLLLKVAIIIACIRGFYITEDGFAHAKDAVLAIKFFKLGFSSMGTAFLFMLLFSIVNGRAFYKEGVIGIVNILSCDNMTAIVTSDNKMFTFPKWKWKVVKPQIKDNLAPIIKYYDIRGRFMGDYYLTI